jgi:general secretion pathway protein G
VLRANLALTRHMLDKFYEDNGKYPDALDDLVSNKYLRSLPTDPIAGGNTSWIVVHPQAADQGAVYDIRSGAAGTALDGTSYGDW